MEVSRKCIVTLRIAEHASDQVRVHDHEARQQRDVAEIDYSRVRRDVDGPRAAGRGDPVVVDRNYCVRDRQRSCAVDQSRSFQNDEAFSMGGSGVIRAGV